MSPTLHSAAVTALTALIADVLASAEPDRFARAERLSKLAQRLLQEDAKRVADFAENQRRLGFLCEDPEGLYGEMRPIGPGIHVPALGAPGGIPGDVAGLYQGLFTMLGPYLKGQSESFAANVRTARASELAALLESRDRLPSGHAGRASIDNRISELARELEGESDDHLVHPEPIRGHSAGEPEQGPDARHDPRPVSRGEEGDGGAPPEGAETGAVQVAVGDLGRGALSAPARYGSGAETLARGEHSGRAEGPGEGPEAAPETTLCGEVSRGEDRGSDGGDGGAHSDLRSDGFDGKCKGHLLDCECADCTRSPYYNG